MSLRHIAAYRSRLLTNHSNTDIVALVVEHYHERWCNDFGHLDLNPLNGKDIASCMELYWRARKVTEMRTILSQ